MELFEHVERGLKTAPHKVTDRQEASRVFIWIDLQPLLGEWNRLVAATFLEQA
jgi:hypothetical protein